MGSRTAPAKPSAPTPRERTRSTTARVPSVTKGTPARPSLAAPGLPRGGTSLVGREGEPEAVVPLLEGTRLLTLTGAPGIDKSRLGLEVARLVAKGGARDAWHWAAAGYSCPTDPSWRTSGRSAPAPEGRASARAQRPMHLRPLDGAHDQRVLWHPDSDVFRRPSTASLPCSLRRAQGSILDS